MNVTIPKPTYHMYKSDAEKVGTVKYNRTIGEVDGVQYDFANKPPRTMVFNDGSFAVRIDVIEELTLEMYTTK